MPIPAFDELSDMSQEDIETELKCSVETFILSKTLWDSFLPDCACRWSAPIRFKRENFKKLPAKDKGLYSFSIRSSNSGLPSHRYVIYIGKAGDDSENTLRKRISSYMSDKRERLLRFVRRFPNNIDVQYCVLDPDVVDIGRVENQLLDSLQPIVNKRDFSPKVGRAKKATGL